MPGLDAITEVGGLYMLHPLKSSVTALFQVGEFGGNVHAGMP